MEIFERLLDTFAKKINYVRKASMGVPKTFVINLGSQLTDQRYDISGNIYYVWSSPKATDYVDIKVNKSSEPALRCVRQTGLITPFDKLLITTPANQSGDMVILYGTEAPELLELIDNRSATLADTAAILAELQGDQEPEGWGEIVVGVAQVELLAANANRKGFSFCSDINNTGDIYLGCDNTVTTMAGGNKWFHVLGPGGSYGRDDYQGPIHAISTIADQNIGVLEV